MLDRYQLGHEIGTGARGAVYRARDRETGRVVAIKLVADAAADGGAAGDAHRFCLSDEQEIRAFIHPHLPKIFETARIGSLRYAAMEFAAGRDLRAHSDPSTRLPLTIAVSVVLRVVDALQHLHQHGFVHGDVKPANILFDAESDSVKLVDIAFCRSGGQASSPTPAYMAPEQVCGRAPSSASDRFAAGVTLYQLASGYLPFAGRSRPEIVRRIVAEPHVDVRRHDSTLPQELALLLDKMLSKNPALRFSSTFQLSEALRELRDVLLHSRAHHQSAPRFTPDARAQP